MPLDGADDIGITFVSQCDLERFMTSLFRFLTKSLVGKITKFRDFDITAPMPDAVSFTVPVNF